MFPSSAIVINLKHRSDRMARMNDICSSEGLRVIRTDGVNVQLQDVRYNEMREMDGYGGRKNLLRDVSYVCGAVGAARAHINAWLYALTMDVSRGILIVEDDIIFAEDWRIILKEALQHLPCGWLQLYLGGYRKEKVKEAASGVLREARQVWHASAILWSKEGLEIALATVPTSGAEVDVALARHVQILGRSYLTEPFVVKQLSGMSNVTNNWERHLQG